MATYFKGDEFKKNVDVSQWYVKDVKVEGPARDLLERYSGIPPDQVVKHVSEVRDRAFENMAYACIGSLRFLNLSLSTHFRYSEVLERLKRVGSTETILDVGCCFGQDTRKLVHDGVSSSQTYATDIDPRFIDLGYDLFLDRDKSKTVFFTTDLFQAENKDIAEKLEGGVVDIVHAASFFHLFDLKQQNTLAINMTKLLKEKPGSMVLGRQLGSVSPGEYIYLKKDGTSTYWHDASSWKQLWKEVGDATNTSWRTESILDEEEFAYKDNQWGDPSMRRLVFAVYRE